jgi:hypothetical protein
MTQCFLINYSNAIRFKTIVITICIVIMKLLRENKKCKMKHKLSQNSM